MKSKPAALPLLIAFLLGANLVATLTRDGGAGPAGALPLLPEAEAHGPQPIESELGTGKTLLTTSPDGSTLYVWYCRIVNGAPTFEGHRYSAGG